MILVISTVTDDGIYAVKKSIVNPVEHKLVRRQDA